MNYLELLTHSWEITNIEHPGTGKAEYLSDQIFDITTYDGEMGELFGTKSVEVCKAISDKKTFDYIADPESYKWYLMIVNTVFFENKLEWGTSIRGAWWNLSGDDVFTINSCGLYVDGDQLLEITFNKNQWDEFVNAMAEFIKI